MYDKCINISQASAKMMHGAYRMVVKKSFFFVFYSRCSSCCIIYQYQGRLSQ